MTNPENQPEQPQRPWLEQMVEIMTTLSRNDVIQGYKKSLAQSILNVQTSIQELEQMIQGETAEDESTRMTIRYLNHIIEQKELALRGNELQVLPVKTVSIAAGFEFVDIDLFAFNPTHIRPAAEDRLRYTRERIASFVDDKRVTPVEYHHEFTDEQVAVVCQVADSLSIVVSHFD